MIYRDPIGLKQSSHTLSSFSSLSFSVALSLLVGLILFKYIDDYFLFTVLQGLQQVTALFCLFKGKFWHCSDVSKMKEEECK